MQFIVKALLVFLIIFSFFVVGLILVPLRLLFPSSTRKILAYSLMFFARITLKVLAIRVNIKQHATNEITGPALCVSNHVSYLDAIILAAIRPLCFVTSQEVRENWFLGPITMLGGCLFVERRNRKNQSNEVEQLTKALSSGLSVLVFPEATSTNATQVVRFRGLLFRSALQAHVPVKPYCLNYQEINQQRFSLENRDIVCWYGDMEFFGHFVRLLQQQSIIVTVESLLSIPVNENTERQQLIAHAYESVVSCFTPLTDSASTLTTNSQKQEEVVLAG